MVAVEWLEGGSWEGEIIVVLVVSLCCKGPFLLCVCTLVQRVVGLGGCFLIAVDSWGAMLFLLVFVGGVMVLLFYTACVGSNLLIEARLGWRVVVPMVLAREGGWEGMEGVHATVSGPTVCETSFLVNAGLLVGVVGVLLLCFLCCEGVIVFKSGGMRGGLEYVPPPTAFSYCRW
jgi:hypothetical protein